MYDQVKKSWAKQSVALDVSQYLCLNHMLKRPNFIREKKALIMGLNFSIFNYLFIGL